MPCILGRLCLGMRAKRALLACHFEATAAAPFSTVQRMKCGQANTRAKIRRKTCAAAYTALAATLVAALPAALPATAQASNLSPATRQQAVALVQQSVKATAPPGARVLVEAGALDSRLKLAPCARVTPYLPAGVQTWGRTRVGLRCTEGARWNVSLPLQVQVLAPAVVSRVALPAGAQLNATQLQLMEVDWAAAGGEPHADVESLLLRVLVRPLQAGQAVRSTDIQPRRWFMQGDTVTLVADGPGFTIATEGRAMSPGMEGQLVRVRTESGRVVQGLAVGERKVEVRL